MSSAMPRFLKKPAFCPSSAAAVSQLPRAPTASLRESSARAAVDERASAKTIVGILMRRRLSLRAKRGNPASLVHASDVVIPRASGEPSNHGSLGEYWVARLRAMTLRMWSALPHRQDAIDHVAGDAEIVGGIDELRQFLAFHVLGDLLVLGQEVEQRAAGSAPLAA